VARREEVLEKMLRIPFEEKRRFHSPRGRGRYCAIMPKLKRPDRSELEMVGVQVGSK